MVYKGTGNCPEKSIRIGRPLAVRCSTLVLGKDVRNKGFALVISLTIMSFVLMLLLSLSLLVQVELQSAQISMKRLVAKENARLGLMLAMGDLQRYAGPDERVTFSSNAYSKNEETIANPYWTGVADCTSPINGIGEIKWLVSSDRVAPVLPTATLTDTNSRVLVGANNSVTNNKVRVPVKNIETNTNKYAYWVSDDSSKVSLATRPELDSQETNWLADSLSETQRKRLGQIIPKRTGIEVLFNPFIEDPVEIYNQISKVNSARHVPLMNAWDFTNYDDYIHSVTDRSYGLLASTTGTGLRSDLSQSPEDMPIPGAFNLIENYKSYMEPPIEKLDSSRPYIPYEDDLRRRYYITAPSDTLEGEISDGIAPVLTDFKILFCITKSDRRITSKTAGSINPILNEDEIVVQTSIYLELWNPYTSALVPENLVLQIKDLPTIQIGLKTSQWAVNNLATHTIDLNDILSNGSNGAEGYFVELPFVNRYHSNHDDYSWLPGRTYSWLGQNNYAGSYYSKNSLLGKFYSRSMSTSSLYKSTGISVANNIKNIEIEMEDDSEFSISLLKKGANLSNGDLLFTTDEIRFNGFSRAPKGITSKMIDFGFRVMRNESGAVLSSGAWDKSKWLRNQDPRAKRPTFDLEGYTEKALLPPYGLNPSFGLNTSTSVRMNDYLFDRTASTSGRYGMYPSEDVPLFELFRQRPLSIGELQHLQIKDRRPFSIGNSWGSENGDRFNRVFDEAFFSGLKKGDTEPAFGQGEALPNHRLRSISEVSGDDIPSLEELMSSSNRTSELLLIDGAFNINSTSSSAWAATLGSIQLPDWEIVNINDDNGDAIAGEPTRKANLGHSFFRFPQSAQEVYHTGRSYTPPGDPAPPPTEYFRVGVKDSENVKDLIPFNELGKQVAKAVSDRIQLLGPFISIESFLSPVENVPAFEHPEESGRYLSVLERAILDVPEINELDGEDIWYHTSSFLSQADVMTALAPIATARGDTFTIRALGEAALDISGDRVATALCEARVQRIPTTVNPADTLRTPDPDGYGRRFVFTSIQWLND